MDIFNRKKVAEQARRIEDLERKNNNLVDEIAALKIKFDEMAELEESVPSDCVRGPWCQACEFVKTYSYHHHYGFGQWDTVTAYRCGKGESCKNFVQKEC